MDGTTEPIVAIIGHPIAGTPTQFALETGLQAAAVDCRVFSIDLGADRVSPALTGMDAMAFRAAWVTPSSRPAVEKHFAVESSHEISLDFLIDFAATEPERSGENAGKSKAKTEPRSTVQQAWAAQSIKQSIWISLVANAFAGEDSCSRLSWITPQRRLPPEDVVTAKMKLCQRLIDSRHFAFENMRQEQIEVVTSPTSLAPLDIETAGREIVVFADTLGSSDENSRIPTWFEDWQPSTGSIIIDLSEQWDAEYLAAWDAFQAAGQSVNDEVPLAANWTCIRGLDVHAKCLSEIVRRLFDRNVATEVFQEAIDEYLAV